jgi:hypothetical protein
MKFYVVAKLIIILIVLVVVIAMVRYLLISSGITICAGIAQ